MAIVTRTWIIWLLSLVVLCSFLAAPSDAATVRLREGGGAGYVDATFDDTYVRGPAESTNVAYGDQRISLRRDSAATGRVALIAIKDLFTLLPAITGGSAIQITGATLELRVYSIDYGSAGQVDIYPIANDDWLTDAAGANENDVSGQHAEVSSDTEWAAGVISLADYDTANVVHRSIAGGSGGTLNSYDVTQAIQAIYLSGINYGLALHMTSPDWYWIQYESSENVSLASRPVLEINYDYVSGYDLTVNSGSGDGTYFSGQVVPITADPPVSGMMFSGWTGQTSGIGNVSDPDTSITMPSSDVEITATYVVAPVVTLTVDSGSGDGTYTQTTVVDISADPPPSGLMFEAWTGQTAGIADAGAADTTITMPGTNVTIAATYEIDPVQVNWYIGFNQFCIDYFGAEKEDLTYQAHGNDLVFMTGPESEWQHASETSAAIAFETNLPASTYVEYGKTTSYGSQATIETDRYHYLHLTHLKDLDADSTYHYRYIAEDERGNTITSGDRSFTTATPADVVYVPGSMGGPPYVLNQSGKTYLLTQDLTLDGMAFDVTAANVTLDLGGHVVIYDNVHWGAPGSGTGDYIQYSKFGVRAAYDGLKVINGSIIQGLGKDAAENISVGYNPIYTGGADNMEMAGLYIEYSGVQQVGIRTDSGNNSEFHHNVLLDTGNQLINRHGVGCRAIYLSSSSGAECHHNLVLRTRQSGLMGNVVRDNEIYVDSWATNSFGISVQSGGEAYGNRVLGTGYHIVAFGWTSDLTYHHNFIHLEGQEPDGRFDEFGDQISLNGFRLTQYGSSTIPYHNNLYHDNVVVVRAREGCQARGAQFCSDPNVVNLVFRDNIVKAMADDYDTTQVACIVTQGNASTTEGHLPVYYEDNEFISNICNIRFGDYYGTGSNHRFYDCTFTKTGSHPEYVTFLWDSYYACKYHVVRDAVFTGGASLDSIHFGSGDHSMTVEWTLTVETETDADVTIDDVTSQQEFSGNAGAGGSVSTPLSQYLHRSSGKTYYTPHSVTAEKDALSRTVGVTMDQTKTIQVYFGTAYTLTVNSGVGGGEYFELQVVSITADPASSGQVFDAWTGDTANIVDVNAVSTTITMPASAAEITATYRAALVYTLTVNSGAGGGAYLEGTVVSIAADSPPSGQAFSVWTGDTAGIANVNAASTTITMPGSNATIMATYVDIAGGPFSRYTFDIDARDDVGINDGSLIGASVVADGERGNVLSLDGENDYVSLPQDNMAAGRSELTVTMWIKPDEWVSTNTIYDEYGGDFNEYWQFTIREGAWYTRDIFTGPMGSRDNDLSMPTVPVGQWHHLAFVYSVSENVKAIYYDGSPYASTSTSVDALTTDRAAARVGYPCDGNYFDGQIDDLRFYDRALEAWEISQLAATLYTLTVTNGTGGGSYEEDDVVAISADPPASGKAFAMWMGDTANIADQYQADTTVTMPSADQEITATYTAITYTLTVNSGSGGGQYTEGAIALIVADAPPTDKPAFREWIGDTGGIANVYADSTTLTMQAAAQDVTATFRYRGDVNRDGVVGPGDLDTVLGNWGQDVPPADPWADESGDDTVGPADLDFILADWGKGF